MQPVNADLYKSNNTPLFQDENNPDKAIQVDFTQQAITEGITNFGNVLAELLKDNVNPEFEGSIYRTIFNINNINISNEVIDALLGLYYSLEINDGKSIQINFEESIGHYLYNLGIYNQQFLNDLYLGQTTLFLKYLELFQKDPIIFSKLWSNYEDIKGTHIINEDKEDFDNYCAINLSHALLKTGVPDNKLGGVRCWGCQNVRNRGKHIIRAQELAEHLIKNYNKINGLIPPKFLTGDNFEDYIKDKKGIIYFEDYWKRGNETEANRSGDHIDLWDGNQLAGSTWIGTRFRLNFPWIAERFGTTDLRKSKRVVFWEIK